MQKSTVDRWHFSLFLISSFFLLALSPHCVLFYFLPVTSCLLINTRSSCGSSDPGSSSSSSSSDHPESTNMLIGASSGPMTGPSAASTYHHHAFGHAAANAMGSTLCNPWKIEPGNTFASLGHQGVHHAPSDPHHDFLLRTTVSHW